jgi:adenine/guanine phosphoribosyltransferase-like PRPP-binding protein
VVIESDYLHCLFDPVVLEEKLKDAEEYLLQHLPPFEVIACRGVSGLMFATLLAYRMKKGLAIVRKPSESTHSCMAVEGCIPTYNDKWLIVDDFISTGNTVTQILNMMGRHNLIGAYFYKYTGSSRFRSRDNIIAIHSSRVLLEVKGVGSDVRPIELRK